MKEIPILFSTPMVQAILAGSKTQTRRVINQVMPIGVKWHGMVGNELCFRIVDQTAVHTLCKCPYGKPGDILWVRETWGYEFGGGILYKASHEHMQKVGGLVDHKWKPSIHMPKAVARIWLQVEYIRVERLQQISQDDIKQEGVRIPVNPKSNGVLLILGEKNKAIDFLPEGCLAKDAPKLQPPELMFAHWAELWCNVNGRESWNTNPWVWAITFKVLSTTGRPKSLPGVKSSFIES